MVPSGSASALQQFLHKRGVDVGTAALVAVVEATLDFYGTVFASTLAATAEADMLLFQFGIYDWGNGEEFEFDITRQFIVAGKVDDDAISQLHCTVYYEPTVALRSIGRGSRWCESREDLPQFRAFILGSDAYATALPLSIKRTDIEWERV
jgi:hypothetical protein